MKYYIQLFRAKTHSREDRKTVVVMYSCTCSSMVFQRE